MSARRFAVVILLLAGCKASFDLKPDGGRPYKCVRGVQSGDGSCPEGMYCSVDLFCRDDVAEEKTRCDADAGTVDAGWPRECGGSFICGADGFCLNPRDELFVSSTSDVQVDVRTLNPNLPWDRPVVVATNKPASIPAANGLGTEVIPVGVLGADGGVHAFLYAVNGIAVSPQRTAGTLAARLEVPGAQSLAVEGDRVSVSTDASIMDFRWDVGTSTLQLVGTADYAATSLSHGTPADGGDEPVLFAWSSSRLWKRVGRSPDASFEGLPTIPLRGAIRDVDVIAPGVVVVATDGLWTRTDDGGWVTLPVPGLLSPFADGGAPPFVPERIHTFSLVEDTVALELRRTSSPRPDTVAQVNLDRQTLQVAVSAVCPICPSRRSDADPDPIPLSVRLGRDPNGRSRMESQCVNGTQPLTDGGFGAAIVTGFEVAPFLGADGGCAHLELRAPSIFAVRGDIVFAARTHQGIAAAATHSTDRRRASRGLRREPSRLGSSRHGPGRAAHRRHPERPPDRRTRCRHCTTAAALLRARRHAAR